MGRKAHASELVFDEQALPKSVSNRRYTENLHPGRKEPELVLINQSILDIGSSIPPQIIVPLLIRHNYFLPRQTLPLISFPFILLDSNLKR